MSQEPRSFWFPAKRYGWGWGPPVTWQGWAVLILWIAVVVVASPFIVLRSLPLFVAFVLAMSLLLMAICYAKGEPPGWRWGGGSK